LCNRWMATKFGWHAKIIILKVLDGWIDEIWSFG
jgi:hypothetical protein